MCLKTLGHIYRQMLNLVSQQQLSLATLDFLQLPGRRIDADFAELLMIFQGSFLHHLQVLGKLLMLQTIFEKYNVLCFNTIAFLTNILPLSNWVVRYITFAKLSATCVRGFRFTATVLTPGETPCTLVVSTRSLVLLP